MVDRRRVLSLVLKSSLEGLVAGQVRHDYLQRNLPAQTRLLGEVDDAHSPSAQNLLDPKTG